MVVLSPAFIPLLKFAVPIFILLIVVKLANTSWLRGQLGEAWVRFHARWGLRADLYKRLHNVTLRTADGTTQIDHVLLSPYGVFVVETKHMRGRILGHEQQAQWTQKLGPNSYRFQNPLRQNYRHLKAVEAALGLSRAHLHSIVVFTGSATFNNAMPPNVVRGWRFVRYIRRFREPVFSPAEVDRLTQVLHEQRLAPGWATHRAHVADLKRRHRKPLGLQVPVLLLAGMAALGLIACGQKDTPLTTQAAKALQPLGQQVNTLALQFLAGTGGIVGRGAQANLDAQAKREAKPAQLSAQPLRACIKPDNRVDEDVRACMNGTRLRDW